MDVEIYRCLSKDIERLRYYEELENVIHIVSGLTLEEIYNLMCEGYCLYKPESIFKFNDLEVFGE